MAHVLALPDDSPAGMGIGPKRAFTIMGSFPEVNPQPWTLISRILPPTKMPARAAPGRAKPARGGVFIQQRAGPVWAYQGTSRERGPPAPPWIARQQPPPQAVAEPGGDKRREWEAPGPHKHLSSAGCWPISSGPQTARRQEGVGLEPPPGDKAGRRGLVAQPYLAVDDVAKSPAGGRAWGQL